MDFDQVFIFLYCLLVTLRIAVADDCLKVAGDICSCRTSKGIVDLHKITSILDIKSGDYTYQFQPCQGLTTQCGSQAGDAVAVCQRTNDGKSSFDVGDKSAAAFSGGPDTNNLQLHYTAGEKTSIFNIICDRNVDGKLTTVKENPQNTYNFNLNTRYSCFGSPSKSKKISTGSVLLIIFFLFLVIYFIAGVLFLKFARGAQGTEVIPNYDFWSSLPGYIKDGIMFTSRGCKTESSYSQI